MTDRPTEEQSTEEGPRPLTEDTKNPANDDDGDPKKWTKWAAAATRRTAATMRQLRRPVDAGIAFYEATSRRAMVGYVLGIIAITGVSIVVYSTFCSLDNISSKLDWNNNTTMASVVVGAHAAVAIAAMAVVHQLLKMSERLLLPETLIDERDVEMVRALTGSRAPSDRIQRTIASAATIPLEIAGTALGVVERAKSVALKTSATPDPP